MQISEVGHGKKPGEERVKACQANTGVLKTCGHLPASSGLYDCYTGHVSPLVLVLIKSEFPYRTTNKR